ncbi:hypothetical protein FALBO_9800 [Fusarium albosuccineum]|uniref:Uncharacterized protein n=1 Tax=Fusarium albosuccineum TaxID=1237068 RepID=A0A8H4L6W0_9HYPO|nr:hypothetical protein FALBO_9800 [Fusarium albosuccineum]
MSRRSRSRSPLNGASRSRLRSRSPLTRETRVADESSAERSRATEASPVNDPPITAVAKSPPTGRRRRGGPRFVPENAAELREANRARRKEEFERRCNLGIEGRLREDGDALVRELKASNCLVFLQVTPTHQSHCRAAQDCLVKHDREQNGTQEQLLQRGQSPLTITDAYRIGVGRDGPRQRLQFYHVVCFDKMTDLASLTPDWFVLCSLHNQWGVMFRELFRHKGQVNLAKIAEYIDAENEYQETAQPSSFAIHRAMHSHPQGEKCTCVLRGGPVLTGHTTGPEEGCSILHVIDNPRNAELGEWVRREAEPSHIFFPGTGGVWKLAIS